MRKVHLDHGAVLPDADIHQWPAKGETKNDLVSDDQFEVEFDRHDAVNEPNRLESLIPGIDPVQLAEENANILTNQS